jgi:hypothetical protein
VHFILGPQARVGIRREPDTTDQASQNYTRLERFPRVAIESLGRVDPGLQFIGFEVWVTAARLGNRYAPSYAKRLFAK